MIVNKLLYRISLNKARGWIMVFNFNINAFSNLTSIIYLYNENMNLEMTIKKLGSAYKFRVGRATGNEHIFLFGLTVTMLNGLVAWTLKRLYTTEVLGYLYFDMQISKTAFWYFRIVHLRRKIPRATVPVVRECSDFRLDILRTFFKVDCYMYMIWRKKNETGCTCICKEGQVESTIATCNAQPRSKQEVLSRVKLVIGWGRSPKKSLKSKSTEFFSRGGGGGGRVIAHYQNVGFCKSSHQCHNLILLPVLTHCSACEIWTSRQHMFHPRRDMRACRPVLSGIRESSVSTVHTDPRPTMSLTNAIWPCTCWLFANKYGNNAAGPLDSFRWCAESSKASDSHCSMPWNESVMNLNTLAVFYVTRHDSDQLTMAKQWFGAVQKVGLDAIAQISVLCV